MNRITTAILVVIAALFTGACAGASANPPATTTTTAPPTTTTTTIYVPPPTTTTTIDTAAIARDLEARCWTLWNSLNDAETLWHDGTITHGAEWKANGRILQGQYREAATNCTGILAAGTISSMNGIAGIIGEMMALY